MICPICGDEFFNDGELEGVIVCERCKDNLDKDYNETMALLLTVKGVKEHLKDYKKGEYPILDLRKTDLPFINTYEENGEQVYQIVFNDISFLMDQRQMDMLWAWQPKNEDGPVDRVDVALLKKLYKKVGEQQKEIERLKKD